MFYLEVVAMLFLSRSVLVLLHSEAVAHKALHVAVKCLVSQHFIVQPADTTE